MSTGGRGVSPMAAPMLPISEFLLARIAEDEARVLAECAAIRAVVEYAELHMRERYLQVFGGEPTPALCRLLARPYRGHPDFEVEWE